jgi:hypothetical protein
VIARPVLVSLACVAAVSLGVACSDDEDDDARRAAEDYALEVERIADDAGSATDRALVTLNRVADDAIDPRRAIGILEQGSVQITNATADLEDLGGTDAVARTADDLDFQLDSTARAFDSAATDLRVAARGDGDLAGAARSNGRVILALASGTSALSRALRELAIESAE